VTIAFGFVSAFWLLAVIPVMWLASSGRLVAHVTRHGLLHVVARSVLLAALIAALAQPVLSLTASRIAVVYLVDVSDSVASSAWKHAADVIDALNTATRPDDSRILAFGGDAVSLPDTAGLRSMAERRSVPEDLSQRVRPGATDLEQALTTAQAEIAPTASGRIVLFSDGRETTGDLQRAARRLAAGHVPVFVEPMLVRDLDDSWIEDVRVPRAPIVGALTTVEVVVGSQANTGVDVSVREGGRVIASRRVNVGRGTSTVSIDARFTSPGAHLVEAVIAAAETRVAFRLHKVWFEVLPAPALAVQFVRPAIIVFGAAAGINLSIDGTAAAENTGLGIHRDAIVGVAQGRCLVAPGQGTAGHFEEAYGHVNERVGVPGASLDQQDFCIGHFGQPRGQHTACRPAANDNVIVTRHLQILRSWSSYK